MHETAQRNAQRGVYYVPSESSYPTSHNETYVGEYTTPINRMGTGGKNDNNNDNHHLRDEVEQLKREVQRLQASGRSEPQSVGEMKQLQSQAVRNLYGESAPPPSYVDTVGR